MSPVCPPPLFLLQTFFCPKHMGNSSVPHGLPTKRSRGRAPEEVGWTVVSFLEVGDARYLGQVCRAWRHRFGQLVLPIRPDAASNRWLTWRAAAEGRARGVVVDARRPVKAVFGRPVGLDVAPARFFPGLRELRVQASILRLARPPPQRWAPLWRLVRDAPGPLRVDVDALGRAHDPEVFVAAVATAVQANTLESLRVGRVELLCTGPAKPCTPPFFFKPCLSPARWARRAGGNGVDGWFRRLLEVVVGGGPTLRSLALPLETVLALLALGRGAEEDPAALRTVPVLDLFGPVSDRIPARAWHRLLGALRHRPGRRLRLDCFAHRHLPAAGGGAFRTPYPEAVMPEARGACHLDLRVRGACLALPDDVGPARQLESVADLASQLHGGGTLLRFVPDPRGTTLEAEALGAVLRRCTASPLCVLVRLGPPPPPVLDQRAAAHWIATLLHRAGLHRCPPGARPWRLVVDGAERAGWGRGGGDGVALALAHLEAARPFTTPPSQHVPEERLTDLRALCAAHVLVIDQGVSADRVDALAEAEFDRLVEQQLRTPQPS